MECYECEKEYHPNDCDAGTYREKFCSEKCEEQMEKGIDQYLELQRVIKEVKGMREWEHKLNFKLFYHKDSLTIEQKGKMVAEKIQNLLNKVTIEYYCGDDLEDLIEDFKHIDGSEETSSTEEFDYAMEQLYDMADRYNIWIETK